MTLRQGKGDSTCIIAFGRGELGGGEMISAWGGLKDGQTASGNSCDWVAKWGETKRRVHAILLRETGEDGRLKWGNLG